MKKVLALVAATGILAAASFASAGSIVGSKHDLSASGTAAASSTGSSSQICVYCHAPHNANLSIPLWNRSNPAANGFTLYSGVNMQNVSFKGGFTSDSTSLFCMSCHDGATQIAAVYNAGAIAGNVGATIHTAAAGVFATGTVGGGANLTTDLSKTHPINFPVSLTAVSQSDLNYGSGATMGPGVAPGFAYAATETFPLFKATSSDPARNTANRSLECGSCHSVHDSANSPFLRYTMTRSRLCLGCHNK